MGWKWKYVNGIVCENTEDDLSILLERFLLKFKGIGAAHGQLFKTLYCSYKSPEFLWLHWVRLKHGTVETKLIAFQTCEMRQ